MAQGAFEQFGCESEGGMLLGAPEIAEKRKKQSASLSGRCSCEIGCSRKCGCAGRGQPCNDRRVCQKNNTLCANKPHASAIAPNTPEDSQTKAIQPLWELEGVEGGDEETADASERLESLKELQQSELDAADGFEKKVDVENTPFSVYAIGICKLL